MSLTQLTDLTGYEVSLVPKGANKKKRFLVTKEDDGELEMDELLEQILKEDLKDEGHIDKVAKDMGLSGDETKALKAVMKMVGAEASPLKKETLSKALKMMGGYKDDGKKDPPVKKEEKKPEAGKADPVKKEGGEPSGKGGNMPNKVPVQKEDGSWDLSKVDESLRPVLEVVCKSNEELAKSLESQRTENKSLADKLKEERDARVLKEFEEKAKSYGHLGQDAKELAVVLKSVHDADPDNSSKVEAILKAANSKIEEGNLFKESGTTGNGSGIAGADAWAKIEKHAEKVCEDDPKIDKAEAIDLVLKKHPDLYREYQDEKRRA